MKQRCCHQLQYRERQVPSALWAYGERCRRQVEAQCGKQTPDAMPEPSSFVPPCYERQASRERFGYYFSAVATGVVLALVLIVLGSLYIILTDPLATSNQVVRP